jgi:maltooligosyltrehalose trehalohydrolase
MHDRGISTNRSLQAGAVNVGSDTWFRVWAPHAEQVDVRLFAAHDRVAATLPMTAVGHGWRERRIEGAGPGTLYKFVVDGRELPDPFARFLPFGVHGPAEVIAHANVGPCQSGTPLERAVLYELHVGTFTPAGTFRAAIDRLRHLVDLGVTAIEMMPVAAFPGCHGWGYDGVAHFAPFAPYGRPEDLRALVEEAHAYRLSVILDVVYNHFGPRGNYLGEYAPEYFCTTRDNPWGGAPDFTTPAMRRYVLDNARMWFEEYGFDGLRLDATHSLHDPFTPHILKELSALAHSYDCPRFLVAEDDRNDPALIEKLGMDAVWADDFHHQMQVLLTGERDGYYAAYEPVVDDLAVTIERGWLYEGQPYRPWGAPRGRPATSLRPHQLVYCVQNHDQVGNRPFGTRLAADAGPEAELAATIVLLFLPAIPLLFMGQEWAASSPFLYFTDHEPELGRLVSEGRRKEFAQFETFSNPALAQHIPDPQAPETFERSRLSWSDLDRPTHLGILRHVRAMLRLRREDAVLSVPTTKEGLRAEARGPLLYVERSGPRGARTLVANLSPHAVPLGEAHDHDPIFSVGEMAAGQLGPLAVAIWAAGLIPRRSGSAPTWAPS